MEPECSPGDLAVIDCDEYPRLGDVVLAVVAGEEILRYLVERTATRIVLVAENTTVADISLSVAEVEIVGVVLTFVRLPKPRRRATERVG
jgi:SOS-response transcriptional repressor LexA